MVKNAPEHKWTFRPRFRKGAFGWRSDTAIKRVKEAMAEIRKVARQNPVLGAEGAVIFLERVSPALEHVDSSSGAIGTAVNRAIENLVKIICNAKTDEALRDNWLDRLRAAIETDGMGYLDLLQKHWGDLCVTPERALEWAGQYSWIVRSIWTSRQTGGTYFHGIVICLSSLFKAKQYQELLELLKHTPYNSWTYHSWGVRSLIEMERPEEALAYVNAKWSSDSHVTEIEGIWERILTDHYPDIPPAEIPEDLIDTTPGQDGK
ncbi:MAG: hypothetical protein CVV64_18340 [Candidatus Wallbacteria bacterium HGW-Wallbacteria-1]|jgi:hypothetical protein|uniref:DNA alkylation repair protein n=1 Tax=Candidatus Wallbacteria bacterium HGW-Wallbacteria-1 TaxID=2013854 RepID=A0A2N1PJP5_9BACT|nr:MAG: hypothetical protein CVV64_18340 [Candidatus Wallbacteria bacterium HGW-Wallbacteria-1]